MTFVKVKEVHKMYKVNLLYTFGRFNSAEINVNTLYVQGVLFQENLITITKLNFKKTRF